MGGQGSKGVNQVNRPRVVSSYRRLGQSFSWKGSTMVRIREKIGVVKAGFRCGTWMVIGHPFQVRESVNRKRWKAVCRCECGKVAVLSADHLRSAAMVRCNSCHVANRNRTHGMSNERLYKVFHGIKQRCENPKSHAWSDYGGRGITLCEEWSNSYIAFRDWAMQNGYATHLQIDRIDNDKGYCPTNCRWTNSAEQGRNRRSNIVLSFAGKTQCVADWERDTGIKEATIRTRLKLGWPLEKALTNPVRTFRAKAC